MAVDGSIVIHMFFVRWQAYLSLDRYQEALADAEKCYELNNSEFSPIISSLLSVGRYKKAFELLENSYALFPEQKDKLIEVYRRCGSLYFEISEAILQPRLRNPNVLKPDADFIGPVEIRMTSNGCGRGLFTTEDIEEGQVILLSKGFAVSGRPMKDQNALLQNVKDALESCEETTHQIFLSHGIKGLSHFIPKMSDFIAGSAVGYPLNWATASQKYYKLAEKEKNRKILLVLNRIALDDSCPAAMEEQCKESVIFNDVPACLYYGVWLLPSFINHSCMPNAARINVGDIQRIHATCKISKDREIKIPYFNVLFPYHSRQRSSAAFGFSCVCVRCDVEANIMDCHNKFKNLYEAYSRVSVSTIQSRATQLQSLVSQGENSVNFLRGENYDDTRKLAPGLILSCVFCRSCEEKKES
ncbi:hypothetical protein SUGI_0114790 [Cryptomeria japonica]|nr:hypothetical protein SUGI_0114790 [Cryptomeria japonica]